MNASENRESANASSYCCSQEKLNASENENSGGTYYGEWENENARAQESVNVQNVAIRFDGHYVDFFLQYCPNQRDELRLRNHS